MTNFFTRLLVALPLARCAVGAPAAAQRAPAATDFYQWAPTPPMGWNSWNCYGPTHG